MLRHLENSTEVERNGAPDVVARELQELASVDVGHAAPLGDVPDALREEHAGGQRVGSRSHRETTIANLHLATMESQQKSSIVSTRSFH